MADKSRDLRKVELPLACVFGYNGIPFHRVEVFDNDRPFFFFDVKQHDYEAMVAESTDKECPVLLAAMLDSLRKIMEYVKIARLSGGVWQRK